LTAAPQQNPIFSTTSELVVLHATAKDRKGRYVTDLSREAFTVFEDKAPQTIKLLRQRRRAGHRGSPDR